MALPSSAAEPVDSSSIAGFVSALLQRPLVAGIAVSGALAATRFVQLDDAPGEWYGDISTVYEYVVNLRNGTSPNGYYALGTGALYPELIRPVLWLCGDSYLSIKMAGALFSMVGLAIFFAFSRRLLGSTFAVLATMLAGTSIWWLIFSRLGDVQALAPTMALAAVACAFTTVRRPDHLRWAAACGCVSSLGVYLYGNTIVLPLISGLVLVGAWRTSQISGRAVLVWLAAATVTLLPMLGDLVADPNILEYGHNGDRFVKGWAAIPNFFRGLRKAILSYVTTGDSGFRGNAVGAAHIDHVSLAFGLVGVIFWLGRSRRRSGFVLLGTFALLHLPVLLVNADQAPSTSRTVAAAPFAYLFVASGIWGVGQLFRRVGTVESVVVMAAIVACIGGLNLYTYVHLYLPGLPYRNVPIARAVVEYIDPLPVGVHVHLVGTAWSDHGMPEFPSIVHAARHPTLIVQDDPTKFDCAAVASLERPAVLVWSFHSELPGHALASCADNFVGVATVLYDSVPVFRTASLK